MAPGGDPAALRRRRRIRVSNRIASILDQAGYPYVDTEAGRPRYDDRRMAYVVSVPDDGHHPTRAVVLGSNGPAALATARRIRWDSREDMRVRKGARAGAAAKEVGGFLVDLALRAAPVVLDDIRNR